MTFVTAAMIVGGATVGAAALGAYSANKAADTQAQSARDATAAQQAAFNRQTELNKPFYDTGVNALNKLSTQDPYTPDAFNYSADPGYAFRFNEGMKGLNATAASRGGLISGNALRAATNYGQEAGSQEYQNAYSRYLTNNAQKLQAYNTNTGIQQNLASMGQGSANNQAAAAGAFGNSAAGNIIGAGNANAAGTVGGANAVTSGLGTYLNYNQNQNMINALNNRNMSSYSNLSNQYGANNVYGGGSMNPIYTPPSVAEYALNNPTY
jgi:hypothetical protein